MPVFHTKTIEGILEPVAQQVSRLVILHEDGEDGNAMPDLSKPVFAVSKAVQNLVIVGRETINSSDDPILKQDMPSSLQRVERASKLLEEACEMLKADPYSQPARKKLIEGARGILGGTSSLLLCFDESEVRKIIKQCKKVLDYLAVTEVIETMEDLVQFVEDLSPSLICVSRDVGAREKELTHVVHRDILIRCLDSVKTLAPILICSMKIYVQLISQHKQTGEAQENRNYLTQRMTDEIHEIIRVLQLTTYDEDEWDADNLTSMKKSLNAIMAKLQAAHDFLEDPSALIGGLGEKSLRAILDLALRIADRCGPPHRNLIKKQVGDLRTMVDALCEMRSAGKGTSPQAQSIARSIDQQLKQLIQLIENALRSMERDGAIQPKHTLAGRLEQAMNWLANPGLDDKGVGLQAINSIVEEARRIANGCSPALAADLRRTCNEVEQLARQLADLCARGLGNSPQALGIAKQLGQKLLQLKQLIQDALVDRVVNDFLDIHTPLKQFTDAVLAPVGTPNREPNFTDKAHKLLDFNGNAVRTARDVASGACGNKRLAEGLLNSASNVESLCPQLVNVGRIRLTHPDNRSADEHFHSLRDQYADSLQRMRNMVDEALDTNALIQATEDAIRKHTALCENSIANKNPAAMVDNTSAIARLANRVLNVAKKEAENSEDPMYINKVNRAADALHNTIAPMVANAKQVAMNIDDPNAANRWRDSNNQLINAVVGVKNAVSPNQLPDLSRLNLNDAIAPPRPKPPVVEIAPPRPPPPHETDDEFDESFPAPSPNQPIMMAAHGLHQAVKQWSSKDNEIIAAAKKMALLMARLSQLIRGEGGSRRDIIACAMAIYESAEELTRLAKEQAKLCTDKRMRTNILQACERIPTIATQLRILCTVKATLLGSQANQEDIEATEMLEGNAQNLMESVKETVRACEVASIKIRTDAGIRCVWNRRQPWYQN